MRRQQPPASRYRRARTARWATGPTGLLALVLTMTPAASAATPRELGDVHFGRNLDAALARSAEHGRPVLILFDEIPGCATCQGFGDAVLGHPLVVEAIETLFEPVAIYNNLPGKDAEALRAFGEPPWNNPAVRIVDAARRMLAPRVEGDYTPAGITAAMITALEAAQRPVPAYLRLLVAEWAPERLGPERAIFTMGCFWTGEVCLGEIDGVVATRAGFFEGHEAVEVTFDPRALGLDALLGAARARGCAATVFVDRPKVLAVARAAWGDAARQSDGLIRASEADDKYHLARSPWRAVPMTRTQAMRANAVIARGQDPSPLLSPRQQEIARRARSVGASKLEFRATDLRETFARLTRAPAGQPRPRGSS